MAGHTLLNRTVSPGVTWKPLGKEEETCGAREDLAEIHQCRSKCESAGCYQMLERWVHRGGKGSRGGGQVEKQKEAEAGKSILEAQVVL